MKDKFLLHSQKKTILISNDIYSKNHTFSKIQTILKATMDTAWI